MTTFEFDGPPPLVDDAPTPTAQRGWDSHDDGDDMPIAAYGPPATKRVHGDRNAPAMRFCTPEFWALIEEAGSSQPQPEGDEWNYRAYEAQLKRWNATVTVSDLATAMNLPPEYARAYLRSIHGRLEALGVTLRERRLKEDGSLGREFWSYTGAFMAPAEKNALYHARGDAKRAVAKAKAALSGDKGNVTAAKALNEAQSALAASELEVAEMKATTESLPLARMAFVVAIDPHLYNASK